MTYLIKASEISGLPVVTIDGGEDAAEIRDVVYDGAEHQLTGFTLNKRGFLAGRLKETLDAADVRSIGRDAVMIPSESVISEVDDSIRKPPSSVKVIGTTVLSHDGSNLGEIVDVIVGVEGHPVAVGYEVDPADGPNIFLPIDQQMSLSNDRLIVPESAAPFIRNDLGGFGAAVAEYRAGTLGERNSQ